MSGEKDVAAFAIVNKKFINILTPNFKEMGRRDSLSYRNNFKEVRL